MRLVVNSLLCFGLIAVSTACGSSTSSSGSSGDTAAGPDDVASADATPDGTAGSDTLTDDTLTADALADDAAKDDVATDDAVATDTAAGGCSATPVSATYVASALAGTAVPGTTTASVGPVGGGAYWLKAAKQLQMSAVTGAGPGKTAPCFQLDISLTLAGDPVVGTTYPVGLGANTGNVALTEFANCEVGKSTNWNAAFANPKAGSLEVVAWDGHSVEVKFTGASLKGGTDGSFTLDGTFKSSCVLVQ